MVRPPPTRRQPRIFEFDVIQKDGQQVAGALSAQRSGYTGLALSAEAVVDVAAKLSKKKQEKDGTDYDYEEGAVAEGAVAVDDSAEYLEEGAVEGELDPEREDLDVVGAVRVHANSI